MAVARRRGRRINEDGRFRVTSRLGRSALRSLTLGPSPRVEREGPRGKGNLKTAGLWRQLSLGHEAPYELYGS
jgi:hypothetical protein